MDTDRDKTLGAADALFYAHGIQAVGEDRARGSSGVPLVELGVATAERHLLVTQDLGGVRHTRDVWSTERHRGTGKRTQQCVLNSAYSRLIGETPDMANAEAGATAAQQQRRPAPQGRVDRARQWWRRAAGSDGHERHTLELVGKSTLAAVVSWVIAYNVMQAQSPAFAPFSAVLIMQVTVYQSALQALRYVGAVAAGVVAQGVIGFVLGPNLLTFALLGLVAMVIGRWRHLGSQGSQVATAAFFAFSTYITATSDTQRWSHLGQIVLLVLIGCGVGVLVNLLVLPPMRYRSAENGIHTLAHSLCNLLGDIHPALREGQLEEDRTSHWRERATQLGPIAEQAQGAVQTAWEGLYYNPRRLLTPRHRRKPTFSGYQSVIDALERVSHQVQSMTRSLDQAQSDDGVEEEAQGSFLRRYGELLGALAHVTELFSGLDEDRLNDQARELCSAAATAQEKRDQLTEGTEDSPLPLVDPSRPYGILMAEAVRLMDELQHTCDVLQQSVEQEAPAR